MSVPFAQSQTRLNLMRAFAGESQARSRYTISAGVAKNKKLYVIEQVFLFTAGQELAHAKLFYRHLQELSGQNLKIDGTYPIDLAGDLLGHLRAAQHNEYQEWEHDYRHFAQVAREEDFQEIGKHFETVADIERIHGDRFGRFADLLERGELFASQVQVKWMCLNCGHVVEGALAPAVCDVCKHPQGYFVRTEMVPFS